MNKAAEKLTGWTPDALFGKPLSVYLTEKEAEPTPFRRGRGSGDPSDKIEWVHPRHLLPAPPCPGEDGETDGELIVTKVL
jgi:PAS domain-containing protein